MKFQLLEATYDQLLCCECWTREIWGSSLIRDGFRTRICTRSMLKCAPDPRETKCEVLHPGHVGFGSHTRLSADTSAWSA